MQSLFQLYRYVARSRWVPRGAIKYASSIPSRSRQMLSTKQLRTWLGEPGVEDLLRHVCSGVQRVRSERSSAVTTFEYTV